MGETNNVFISWSGVRSKAAAEALREWLPIVLQGARPWMSDTDIEKGSRGLDELGRALEGMKIGIICLTPENLTAEWINYEAGGLSKTLDAKTRVCTYLLVGLQPQDIKAPLGMFQSTRADKEDTRKLIHAINKALDVPPVPEANLSTLFEGMWPRLQEKLDALPTPEKIVQATRPMPEMVAEILELTRAAAQSRKAIEGFDEYIPIFKQFMPLLAEALKTAQKQATPQGSPAREGLAEAPIRTVFRVKQHDDAEFKRVEGVNAAEDGSGQLFVLDERNRVIARFANVEQWWPEPTPASIGGKIEPSVHVPGETRPNRLRAHMFGAATPKPEDK